MTGTGAAVELHDVWRRYRIPSTARSRGLRASFVRDPLRRSPVRWHWALRGVDLSVGRGESVALIGRNGAGKSTLLRLIGGVGRPDRGSVAVSGRVAALMDLGHEFHGDLTGRQNAEIAGLVAGMSRRGFRQRFGQIVAFAELEDFVDEPLRVYSDGMRTRLAFSVMVHLDPDVLLVDEVLAVGDAPFQRRSIERIRYLQERGTAVVFVSHDLSLVRRVCGRAVWLDGGVVRARGASAEVVRRYADVTAGDGVPGLRATGRGRIRTVRLADEWGVPAAAIRSGDGLAITVEPDRDGSVSRAQLRVRLVRSVSDVVVVDTSTTVLPADGPVRVRFHRLDVAPGDHRVEAALFSPDWSETLAEAVPVPLRVHGDGPDTATLAPPHEWEPVTDGG